VSSALDFLVRRYLIGRFIERWSVFVPLTELDVVDEGLCRYGVCDRVSTYIGDAYIAVKADDAAVVTVPELLRYMRRDEVAVLWYVVNMRRSGDPYRKLTRYAQKYSVLRYSEDLVAKAIMAAISVSVTDYRPFSAIYISCDDEEKIYIYHRGGNAMVIHENNQKYTLEFTKTKNIGETILKCTNQNK
jgi:hypothetical protein